MPHFFLHQRRESEVIPDDEGAEFPGMEQAREEAILAARELIAEMARKGVVDLTPVFQIVGVDGQTIEVPFASAVALWTREI